jgi:cellobiose phosphorylase
MPSPALFTARRAPYNKSKRHRARPPRGPYREDAVCSTATSYNDRLEYVIDRVWTCPASWTNYLGTEEMCAVVNHTAGGYLFH